MPWAAQELQVKSNPERTQGAILAAFVRGEMRGVMMPAQPISTHLSHVFLTGTRAFKLKRALRCSFADFSDVAHRRAACEAELAANRHMAGSLYDRALPVTQGGDHRYGIDGAGEIVDWVVVMRRFEESQQFDHFAARGALTVSLVERLAQRIGTAHMAAPSVVEAGRVSEYRQALNNFAGEMEAKGVGTALNLQFLQYLLMELASIGDKIERRRAQGRVRRGHGDLRLNNICMWDGVPTPFDASPLSQRLATADVLCDLAFLLMDLHRLGLHACAEAVVRRYWAATGEEEEAMQLLPFFMAMRAAERMAVAREFGDHLAADAYRGLGLRILTSPPAAFRASYPGCERNQRDGKRRTPSLRPPQMSARQRL